MYIWQSLNKNQKQIAQFIASNALKNKDLEESETSYYTFNDLLEVCIEEVFSIIDRLCYHLTTS